MDSYSNIYIYIYVYVYVLWKGFLFSVKTHIEEFLFSIWTEYIKQKTHTIQMICNVGAHIW